MVEHSPEILASEDKATHAGSTWLMSMCLTAVQKDTLSFVVVVVVFFPLLFSSDRRLLKQLHYI